MIAPLPVSITNEPTDGYFVINQETQIILESFPSFSFDPFKVFSEVFEKKSGYALGGPQIKQEGQVKTQTISVIRSNTIEQVDGYELNVLSDHIVVSANNETGIFYALQTLRQMMRMDALPNAKDQLRNWSIPTVSILDYPQFTYRGMHLDVCRHYMPVEFVKKYIDLLAYYKMNRFHWHLTDDQGWRIEIKQFPKLQEVAAWRDETLIGHYRETPDRYDGIRHGGYYTHEEIKDVVAYAAQRGVTIIPEIEMPGHAQAALAAYPKLGCTAGPYEVVETWGVFDEVFCPRESTFVFLEKVLDEVMELFPSPYIHIGGDECPKTRWKSCPHCQARMQEEGLKDEHELQSYFITRIEKYVNSKGRNIIGWDEILEGGLAPNATVMSWRGMKGGIDAAKSGHDVIMTPGTHCYFDYYQADPAVEPLAIGGLITLEKVYSFNPVPADLTSAEAKHILGAQANLWTEYIGSPQQAEYMAYPRAIALAEVLWTPASRRDWPEFAKRLNQHLERLDGMQVNYARHLNDPSIQTISDENGLAIIWKSQLPGEAIFYSRDTTKDDWTKVTQGDITIISTRGPVFYKSESSKIYSLDYQPTKAKDAKISVSSPPDQLYPGAAGIWTLIDGLDGTIHFNGKDWCGWRGQEFTIDLLFSELTTVDSVRINFLNSPGAWIHTPESFKIEGSIDGNEFKEIASWHKKPLESGRHTITLVGDGSKVKALKIHILPVLSIPEGKAGAGKAAWTFLDEISVY